MVCAFCPTVGVLSGFLGGYFGIHPPKTVQGKIFSGIITAALTATTVIALKVFLNISLCLGGELSFGNIIFVAAKTVPMGILYSLGVNYLINRFSSPPICCCNKKNGSSL